MSEKNPNVERLIQLAINRTETIDGEWGCCHDFPEMAVSPECAMREDAVEVIALAHSLGFDALAIHKAVSS